MTTTLVTGATGFIGRHLCDALRRAGKTVRGLARRVEAYPFTQAGIQLFHGTLPDEVDAAAFDGVDVVIHCAYATRARSREEAHRVNHAGTAAVYEASRRARARFVFISSIGAHPAAESYYGRSKYELEQRLDLSTDLVIRPGLVLGPPDQGLFGRLAAQIRQTGVAPIFDGGRQVLQTIHIDDLCRAIELAIEQRRTGVLVLAEPDGVPMRTFLRLVAARLGRRCLLVPLPLGPTLMLVRTIEALRLPCPLSSENLLGLKHMVHVPSAHHLTELGITVRPVEQSLTAALGRP